MITGDRDKKAANIMDASTTAKGGGGVGGWSGLTWPSQMANHGNHLSSFTEHPNAGLHFY